MVRSPHLQQEYARLGLARADVLEAVETANPHVSASYLTPTDSDGSQLTVEVAMPLVDLLMLPARLRLANAD